MKVFSDQNIVDSWQKNFSPWISAIRQGEIDSRIQITNKAVLEAILLTSPKKVLDIGCGEGWLVRELTKEGVKSFGVDIVPELISAAVNAGFGRYEILSYEELSYEVLNEKYDVVVANFSLLGNESVNEMFIKVPVILEAGGYFIVQTLHPKYSQGNKEYVNGWRKGNWDGFGKQFTDPAPWFFRTVESWKLLFKKNGFILERIEEPINMKTGTPASIIFVGIIL